MYRVVISKFAPADVKKYIPNWPLTYDEAQKIVDSVSIGNRLFFSVVKY